MTSVAAAVEGLPALATTEVLLRRWCDRPDDPLPGHCAERVQYSAGESAAVLFADGDVLPEGKEIGDVRVPLAIPSAPITPENVLTLLLVHIASPDSLFVDTLRLHDRDHPGEPRPKMKCELWSRVWASSILLCELMLVPSVSDLLATAGSVMEIGAGTGLCSLVAAAVGCRSVKMTDVATSSLQIGELSAGKNGVAVADRVSFEQLSWHAAAADSAGRCILAVRCRLALRLAHPPPSAQATSDGMYDLVLASDVLFVSANAEPVAALLSRLLRRGGTALLIDPGRPSATGFDDALASAGLTSDVYTGRDVEFQPGEALHRVVLHRITKLEQHGDTAPSARLASAIDGAWGMMPQRCAPTASSAATLEADMRYMFTTGLQA